MDYFEKADELQVKEAIAKKAIDEDAVCCVCLNGDSYDMNAIMFCDLCKMAVHQECYGVPYLSEGQWVCRKCLQSPTVPVKCVLCPNEGGAFRRTDDNRWCHIVCALWIPEVEFVYTVFLEPITGINKVDPERWKLKCEACKQPPQNENGEAGGACIQCCVKNCAHAYYVTCAQEHGFHLEIKEAPPNCAHIPRYIDGVEKTTCCKVHSRKFDKLRTPPGMRQEAQKRRAAEMKRDLQSLHQTLFTPERVKDLRQKLTELANDAEKEEFVYEIYKYWQLKREARSGVPLLRRLVVQTQSSRTASEQLVLNMRRSFDRFRHLCDLLDGHQREQFFKRIKDFRILCCGGYGTVGWVLDVLDRIAWDRRPPVAILPLGTGNHLARCLRCGSGYTGESLFRGLRKIENAEQLAMDRWCIEFSQPEKRMRDDDAEDAEPNIAEEEKGDPIPYSIINNYFSIGVDALVCHRFHNMREKCPAKFNSRLRNKMWYFEFIATETFAATYKNLHEDIDVICDGVSLDLARGTPLEALCLLNIPSIYGGSNLWGETFSSTHEHVARRLTPADNHMLIAGDAEQNNISRPHHSAESLKNNKTPPKFKLRNFSSSAGGANNTKQPLTESVSTPPPSDSGSGVIGFTGAKRAVSSATSAKLAASKSMTTTTDQITTVTSGCAEFVRQDIGDGMIEVVGVENLFQAGQVRDGFRSSCRRLAQCSSVVIRTRKRFPMQIDGEPWMQPPCTISITRKNQTPMLLAPAGPSRWSLVWSLFRPGHAARNSNVPEIVEEDESTVLPY